MRHNADYRGSIAKKRDIVAGPSHIIARIFWRLWSFSTIPRDLTMTNDPLANLKTITDLDIRGMDAFAELSEPFDDVPGFDPKANPEIDTHKRLDGDRTFIRTPRRRHMIDYRAQPDAYKHLAVLPTRGEDLEMVISGKYAMWDLVPSLIERTGQNIDALTIATLSYSKQNAEELLGLIDGGQVKTVGLLISYYFKSTSRELYDSLVPELLQRGHRVVAMRTHAKIILAKMADGTCYTFRGSPNLRSAKNIEALTLTNCPDLCAFHHGWIQGELLEGSEVEGYEKRSRQHG